MISNKTKFISKLCAIANECKPKGMHNIDKNRKVENDYSWVKPKKQILIIDFFKPCKNKEEFQERNNKHSMLVDNGENDNGKDDEMKENANKLKRTTDKVNKKSKMQKKKVKMIKNAKKKKTKATNQSKI